HGRLGRDHLVARDGRRRQARRRAVRRAGQAQRRGHRQPVRQFASSGFRIWNLSREAKLIYTCFGLFSIAAIAVSMMFYEDLVGPKTAGVAGYYAGAKQEPPAA